MLAEMTKQIGAWAARNFSRLSKRKDDVIPPEHQGHYLGSLMPLMGMTEELGELYHVMLKRHQGIRGYDNDAQFIRERDDAVADLCIYLMDFCAQERICLQSTIEKTASKVLMRDWVTNPKDAAQIAEVQEGEHPC